MIEKYGADGVRVGMLLCSPAGNDLPFDEGLCEQGRNFSNKIWNAFRLINGWEVDTSSTLRVPSPFGERNNTSANKIAAQWFDAKFNEQLNIINDLYSKYRMSEALMATYKLVWDDFCAWYLEMIKPELVDGKSLPIDKETYDTTIIFFEKILKVLHPFMPFITEEIWHLIKDRKEKDCIIIAEWPKVEIPNSSILLKFEVVAETITQVRNIRKSKNISPKEKLSLYLKSKPEDKENTFDEIIIKLCNLSAFELTSDKLENSISFMVKQFEFYIPFSFNIDVDAEKDRLAKDLEYNKGFLKSVEIKLANEKFVANAKPELLANEKKKQTDAEAKIRAIEEQLASLK